MLDLNNSPDGIDFPGTVDRTTRGLSILSPIEILHPRRWGFVTRNSTVV